MKKIIFLLTFMPLMSLGQPALLDKKATTKTHNLYNFLFTIKPGEIMFGHQDDQLYGLTWKYGQGSDVELISGNRPSVVGWDIGKLGQEVNIDSFRFDQIIKGIKTVYKAGGINTISWHMDHPLTRANSWDKNSQIKDLLPGGPGHDAYVDKLNLFVKFLKKCRSGFTKIPIIIRPFHEHNGDWFWWGKSKNSEDDYIALWRFTVDYLRDRKNIHQLIYVFSPDRSRMEITPESYAYGYPGDDYVDIIGLDDYWDMGHRMNRNDPEGQTDQYLSSIQLISEIAKRKQKVAALSETGNETVRVTDWFTQRLLNPIKENEVNIAWALVWRNANMGHFYVPYKGHHNEQDFIDFEADASTLFLSDITNPYKKTK